MFKMVGKFAHNLKKGLGIQHVAFAALKNKKKRKKLTRLKATRVVVG